MKTIIYHIAAFILLSAFFGCEKYADDYKDYLDNKEVVYPGLAKNVRYKAGNLRTVLVWNPSPDPNIKNYVVKWNNGIDSAVVEAHTHNPEDSITVSIPNLNEYVYSFSIKAYDSDGNASIGQEINNVRVYGATFQSVLLNRSYNLDNPYEVLNDGSVTLHFHAPDTMNTGTKISYISTSGEEKNALLLPTQNQITLADFKFGTEIQYRSAYIPEPNAADTFFTSAFADFPVIYRTVLTDKSLFQPMELPGDAGTAWGWELPYIWDGNTGEPGYHTPDLDFPVSFSLDMGAAYRLSRLKIWQRMSGLYNYGNPKRFEVWGSNNPNADGSWDSWTQLGTFTTVKPSGLPVGENSEEDQLTAEAGDTYTFPEIQEFRYLRFKVLETWGGTNYFHIVELSLYHLDQ